MPWNTRLKPYTTRMTKIQGSKEGKTYSNIYKEEWIQPWPMSSKIYPKVHENPRAFFSSSSPSLLESSIQYPWGVGLHQRSHECLYLFVTQSIKHFFLCVLNFTPRLWHPHQTCRTSNLWLNRLGDQLRSASHLSKQTNDVHSHSNEC